MGCGLVGLCGFFLLVFPQCLILCQSFSQILQLLSLPFLKVEGLASCLLFDLFPNQHFNKIILEGNFSMRYRLRKKYPCLIGPAWGNSEETWMSCLIRLTSYNAHSVSCEPDLFPLFFQAVRLFPFHELYPMMGYSFHNILLPDLPLIQSVWFGLVWFGFLHVNCPDDEIPSFFCSFAWMCSGLPKEGNVVFTFCFCREGESRDVNQ